MAEPVGDLVVDLSLDAARFDEQMARVRRHFSGTESDAKKTAAVVEQSMNRQALAAQKAGISVGQYKAAMRMLPAQFTDVATQLAGGQSPWLIPAATGWSGEGLLRRDDPHVQGACPVRSPCRWSGPPRWRWRPVRWRMPGIRATQPCPISTKRWSFPAISRV
ncbi:tail component of prophage CP-933X [Escherichia coli]|nr:tail component of prophage CP-933X [Escherichia coli]